MSQRIVKTNRRGKRRRGRRNRSTRPAPRRGNIFWRRGYNKIYRKVNMLAAALNVETKYLTTDVTGTITDTYANENLALIDQGDGQSNRDGNSCKATRLEVRAHLTLDNTVDSSIVRFLLIMKKAGGAPIQTDILKDATLVSPYNLDTKDQYSIIRDEVLIVNTNNPTKYIYWDISLNNKIRFTDTTATYAATSENSFTLGMFSDRATNAPALILTSAIYFVDN